MDLSQRTIVLVGFRHPYTRVRQPHGPMTAAFDALERWVELGRAPDRIVATARADNPQNPWPGRTLPLCPYPQYARYVGSGSIENAASFVCSNRP
ncbi:MAG: tannase/feruloyl esterase family alpha/beta hydrolase [Steroidobacteraceae bacterium]